MRLIDADVLMPNAEYKGKYDTVNAYDIVNCPTVDAVEVVRCKDCIYYQPDGVWYDDDVCKIHPHNDNGYCAWAERREDAETD